MKNYYEILEVNQKASKEIIEKAYHVLVKKYHPDLYDGLKKQYAEKKIKEVNEAYDILSDDFFREQYDKELEKLKNEVQPKQERQRHIPKTKQEPVESTIPNYKPGSFGAIVEITKMVFRDFAKGRQKRREIEKDPKKNAIAIVLTIIVLIIIGIILWFIPFTNGWMRELLFENPLFNWIGGLFG